MSKFSENFNEILKNNNISVYSLSKCSGVARTSIYKYLNGKTLPKKEFLDSIIDVLCMSTKQKLELWESYKMEVYGKEVYLSFKKFKQFIENLNKNLSDEDIEFLCEEFKGDKKIEFLDNSTMVQFYLRRIIENEMSRKDRIPTIYTIIQPSCKYLFDLIYNYAKHKNISLNVNHVISFERMNEGEFCKAENVDVLSKLLVAAIFNEKITYNLNYYYENNDNQDKFNQVFPYFVVADEKVILISHDYETGLYINKESVYNYFKDEFDRISKWCSKFIQFNRTMLDLVKFFKEVDTRGINYSYVIGAQPCIVGFLTPEMIQSQKNKLDPAFLQIAKLGIDRLNTSRERLVDKPFITYFTLEGLDYFCNEGKIIEFPSNMNVVFNKKEILYTLNGFYEAVKQSKIEAYLVNTDIFKIPINVVVTSYELDYINIFYNDLKDDSITAIIREKGMTELINYFFEDLKSTEYVYSKDKTLEEIKKRIELLEKY